MKNEHKKESKLSGLYAQRHKLKEKLVKLGKDKDSIESEIKNTNEKLVGVNKGIEYLEGREILLTTHFIARYIQRIGPATEDEMRERILTPQLLNMIRTLGNGTYPVEEFMVRVEDNKLITIMTPEGKEEKKERTRANRKRSRNGRH
ncbi:MAG: hypothetical protein RLZZ196_2947 [Bacteroidota bacterium]|jgi:septal ring factor EnvC (AmiA/AmiB activator)